MNKSSLAALVFVLVFAPSARAEGWSWPNWFGSDEPAQETRTPTIGGRPIVSPSRSSPPSEPGMFQRMADGTRGIFSRTRDALSFSHKGSPRGRPRWGDASVAQGKRKNDEQEWSLFSWFRREEPRPSKTVEDFLGQPRPEDF